VKSLQTEHNNTTFSDGNPSDGFGNTQKYGGV
jgi:hypothetical protein